MKRNKTQYISEKEVKKRKARNILVIAVLIAFAFELGLDNYNLHRRIAELESKKEITANYEEKQKIESPEEISSNSSKPAETKTNEESNFCSNYENSNKPELTVKAYSEGELYKELLEFYHALKVQKHVESVKERMWSVAIESELFEEQEVEVFIADYRVIIEPPHGESIVIEKYELELDDDENIILKGIDSYRNYYEFKFRSDNKMLASGGKNADVLGINKSLIVGTCENGTLTFQNGILRLWNKRTNIATCWIPEPEGICQNYFGERGVRVNNPYISKDGKAVLLQTYTGAGGKLTIECYELATGVKRIVGSYEGNIFQNKNGTYSAMMFEDKYGTDCYDNFGFYKLDTNINRCPSFIPLNKQTVEKLRFGTWGSSSYKKTTISYWTISFTVKGYGIINCPVYTPDYPVVEDEEFRAFRYEMSKEFPPNEYIRKYIEVVRRTKELEKEAEKVAKNQKS